MENPCKSTCSANYYPKEQFSVIDEAWRKELSTREGSSDLSLGERPEATTPLEGVAVNDPNSQLHDIGDKNKFRIGELEQVNANNPPAIKEFCMRDKPIITTMDQHQSMVDASHHSEQDSVSHEGSIKELRTREGSSDLSLGEKLVPKQQDEQISLMLIDSNTQISVVRATQENISTSSSSVPSPKSI